MNTIDGATAAADTGGGGRPRAKTMVRLDLHNAYARLGVSPLMPTEEIKEVINRRRKEVMRRRRTRGEQRFGEEGGEMTRLQAIENEIGTPKARARYDRLNPQNALLTIQPSPGDVGLDPKHRAGLATAWLVEALGRDAALPSPESLASSAARGLGPDLVAFLASFAGTEGSAVYQGDNPKASLNFQLGDVVIEGLAAGPKGSHQFQVTFALDADGIFFGEALHQQTGQVTPIKLSRGQGAMTEK